MHSLCKCFDIVDDSFDEILLLITDCFQIGEKSGELEKIYYIKQEISCNLKSKFFSLKKNNAVINFRISKIGNNINLLNKVSSLLNSLFDYLLYADTKLIIDPSGYHTYLVQLLINGVKIITLSDVSSTYSLFVSTRFFDLEEVNGFLFINYL